MQKKWIALTVIFLAVGMYFVLGIGAYPPISGTVVDEQTQKPIEGAVVLVEWTKTHGFGEHWTESFYVEETITDKVGKFAIGGLGKRTVNKPNMTIYKKGYVAWSNRWIYPFRNNRKDFRWKTGGKYGMVKFEDTFSSIDHDSFVNRSINDTIGWEKKQLFIRMYEEGERKKVIKDQKLRELDGRKGYSR